MSREEAKKKNYIITNGDKNSEKLHLHDHRHHRRHRHRQRCHHLQSPMHHQSQQEIYPIPHPTKESKENY